MGNPFEVTTSDDDNFPSTPVNPVISPK